MSMMLAERGEGKKDDSKSPSPATGCHLLLFPVKGHSWTLHSYRILGESLSWAWMWVFRTPDRGSGPGSFCGLRCIFPIFGWQSLLFSHGASFHEREIDTKWVLQSWLSPQVPPTPRCLSIWFSWIFLDLNVLVICQRGIIKLLDPAPSPFSCDLRSASAPFSTCSEWWMDLSDTKTWLCYHRKL